MGSQVSLLNLVSLTMMDISSLPSLEGLGEIPIWRGWGRFLFGGAGGEVPNPYQCQAVAEGEDDFLYTGVTGHIVIK